MKYIIALFCFFLLACGKSTDSEASKSVARAPYVARPGACDHHPEMGRWAHPQSGDVIELYGDCTGTSSSCDLAFSYSYTNANQATLQVTASSERNGCMKVGIQYCYFNSSGNSMLVDCQGPLTYVRQE